MNKHIRATKAKLVSMISIPKAVVQDSRLNWKSRGIYSYLCSFGQDTIHKISDVVSGSSRDGRISTITGIKQLIRYGYVQVLPVDNRNGGYRWCYYWHLNT